MMVFKTLGLVTLSITSLIMKHYWNEIQVGRVCVRDRETDRGRERETQRERHRERGRNQEREKQNRTAFHNPQINSMWQDGYFSPSAVTVNSGLGKMSKMFSCAWAELITEPKATQTRAANGLDLQIKLHLPRLFFSYWSNLLKIKYFISSN